MRAFIFPGQGSQKVGMGAELAAASAAARAVFEEVDEALGQHLSRLMREGPEDELTLTANAQPAIMAAAAAMVAALAQDFGVRLTDHGGAMAGHSLGEYTALHAAGAFSLADTARLLRLRGEAMQAAVPVGVGAMAALLGADVEKAQALCDASAHGQVCEIANDNDPSQVVVSGHADAVARVLEQAREHGVRRAVKLPVSAPFHCSLMEPAAKRMDDALAEIVAGSLNVPVYANVTAQANAAAEAVRGLLVRQVTGRVRWRETVHALRRGGVEQVVEIGSKVLGPMVSRTEPAMQVSSLTTMADLECFARSLG
ncbi:[acyl-carrier-protein] S-malonyltransferase [Erythrobacteraceae bacterium CFH 75059]|uniref:ACP S-malonyltransferase n=1 Tax=Qipengyuania thermophila TaxID=2509361 RepID=UPI001021951C|nr:ACP S-malonyltransferase [Qipengyuania thermophila]TCD05368.1 [acyl-carrier-protein] S-malonyltransferase [Erythrobacteraceae bacterium CFH 75059]